MKAPVVKFLNAYQKDADEVLQEAREMGFETVMIVGIGRDRTVSFCKSANSDMLQVLGSLEAIKAYIFENWE